jgi:uncharacterized membrane protein
MNTALEKIDWTRIALVVIVAIGFGIRLVGISTHSLWYDEAASVMLAKMSLTDMVAKTATDVHPPFYFATLSTWCKVFGFSAVSLRMLSILFGVGSILLLFKIAAKLFDKQVALASAALLAVSDMHVFYSQEIRMYALQTLLCLASTYFLIRAREDDRIRWRTAGPYALFMTLALYTHYYSMFFMAVQGLFLLWDRPKNWKVYLIFLPPLLLFSPWALTVIPEQMSIGNYGWQDKVPLTFSLVGWTPLHLLIGEIHKQYIPHSLFFFICLLLPVLLLGAKRAFQPGEMRSGARLAICCGPAMWLLVILISTMKMMYLSRYFVITIPLWLLLVACGIRSIPMKKVGMALLAVVLMINLAVSCNPRLASKRGHLKKVFEIICREGSRDDVVVFHNGYMEIVWNYYVEDWRGKVYATYDMTPPDTWSGLAREIDREATNRRLWLVLSKDKRFDAHSELAGSLIANTGEVEKMWEFFPDIRMSKLRLRPHAMQPLSP